MKSHRHIVPLLITLCYVATALHAQTYWTPATLPMVHLQDACRYVVNPDGVLQAATVDSADHLLARLEHDAGVQTVVVVVGHIDGNDPYHFGQALADQYGIGHRGRDDGLLVLLCRDDRSYSILTGDGLEGVLPDALCYRIEQSVMVPLLRQGKWDEALLATLTALDHCIRQDDEMMQYTADDDDFPAWIGLLIFGFGLFVALPLAVWVGKRKCPSCGRRKLEEVQQQRVVVGAHRTWRTVYRCKHCGHISHHDRPDRTTPMGGIWGTQTPRFGGGFGQGGSFGGSFGGGHFGGGGASGRF